MVDFINCLGIYTHFYPDCYSICDIVTVDTVKFVQRKRSACVSLVFFALNDKIYNQQRKTVALVNA